MKLIDLKKIVDATLEMHPGERGENLEVVIPVIGSSFGPISRVCARGATKGFDWNNSLFIIWPEHELIINPK